MPSKAYTQQKEVKKNRKKMLNEKCGVQINMTF